MLTLALLFLVAQTKAQTTVKDCALGSSVFVLNSLSVEPNKPLANQNFTVNLDYTVPDLTIETGTATYSLTYNYLPITPTTEDLCLDTVCPITPGKHSQSSTSLFPQVSGTLVTKSEWYDDSSNLLLCYQLTMKV
jgi:ML domain